jgi:hypothetical protein
MNTITKGISNALVTSLVLCGLLAIAGPWVLANPALPDATYFAKVFAVCAFGLIIYELIFSKNESH